MRILTLNQVQDYEKRLLVHDSRRRWAKLGKLLDRVSVKQTILVASEDWPFKTTPAVYIGSLFRRERSPKRFRTRVLKDKSGWLITRFA